MNKKVLYGLVIFLILYVIIRYTAGFYIDYEWFKSNSGVNIFTVLFFSKFNVHIIFSIAFAALFGMNFILIRILAGKGRIFTNNILDRLELPVFGTPRKALSVLLILVVIIISIIMGNAASSYWKEYLNFMNSVPFAGFPKDPLFNMDISFYVFELPFYQFLYGWFMSAFGLIAVFSIFFHMINGGIQIGYGKLEFSLFARAHISTLLGYLVFLHGLGYKLSSYELLFSKIGKFYGAGYTAVNANLLAYNVAMVISFAAALLLFINLFIKSFKMPMFVLAALLPLYFLLGTIYPAVQQRFIVEPNELDKEKPFIANNIKFTRIAYDIERIKETAFPNSLNLTYADIAKNREVLENIRLWDWKPLKQTYKQLQELKPYYFFNDVDVDRYMIDGRKIAVNLSARELSIDQLSKNSQTWQNKHLIYTHGYGVVMSRVDKITPEGLPEMAIYDIPPKSDIEVKIERPEIYFGEHKDNYVLTNTSISPGEFDYPSGDDNKYTNYSGTGGVVLDSFLKRIMFAAAFADINILISGAIDSKSKMLYNRNISAMVKKLTPFLTIDNDPYLVISDKKLYWIIDAYTTTDQFPYSTPIDMNGKSINYIRNSVKIVIDAYNGKMTYYISDEKDPLLKTYTNIFQGIFKSISEMPADLKSHVRYPENIFMVQSNMLLRYHMTNTNIFYNNEDAWHIPRQTYDKSEVQIESYYLVTKLPNVKFSEFIHIMPFTPYKKNNMVSFLAARCDFPNYGELLLYNLPKDKLSYGPQQIEARIDQDPEISKQLTLWNQKGSGVIRGNMMAIPIEDSILFIEPLYLKAESSEMPELKRVIVSFADKVVMDENLPAALEKIFSGGKFMDSSRKDDAAGTRMKDLASRAYNHYLRAEQNLKEGNWGKYGEELNTLKDILFRMQKIKE